MVIENGHMKDENMDIAIHFKMEENGNEKYFTIFLQMY